MVKIARILFVFFTVMMVLSSCDNGKSYADLLKEEDKAVKAFLADKIVINSIPADSVFVTLQDVGNNDTLAVPYYRLDDDGNVYMQVLDAGIQDDRFEKGNDVIHFGNVGVIGKIPRIGHHSRVDGFCGIQPHAIEHTHATNQPENQFAG